MRYPAAEKLEIIHIVERSHLSARQTLDKIGIPRPSFYRWYDIFLDGGFDALEDKHSRPSRVWSRIPDKIRNRIIDMHLKSRNFPLVNRLLSLLIHKITLSLKPVFTDC